jgi:hypothetical protein
MSETRRRDNTVSDTQTLFQSHIERMADEAEDQLVHRKTGVDCEYVGHPEGAPFDAVVIVGVDTSSCCIHVEDNKQVRVCWMCIIKGGHRDAFVCRCGENNSTHESKELTFVGEIQISAAAEKAAREAAAR